MKPYDIINHTIEDLISSHLKDDYCLQYFPDNIRYNHSETIPFKFTMDKHVISGNHKSKRTDPNWYNYFFHYDKWIHGKSLNYHLRDNVNYNFLQHSWEPIDLKLDKVFWQNMSNIVVLHSEKASKDLDVLVKSNIKNIHWFSHAYICSEIYFKHFYKLNMVTKYKVRPIKHKWISANRLLRQHRVDLLEKLDLQQGCYSLMNPDPNGLKYKGPVPSNSFDKHGNDSAELNFHELTPWNTSFLHIVNETIWQEKIHFTEKIFKPIILHQPFVVVQAPNSLEYLRSYGFRTFDHWWDESYDKISDPNKRLNAIADIINYIGNKSLEELEVLRMEMADVLEHNFRHFYENIPAICLDELEKNIKLL